MVNKDVYIKLGKYMSIIIDQHWCKIIQNLLKPKMSY